MVEGVDLAVVMLEEAMTTRSSRAWPDEWIQ
jgi:hypothetical protein